MFSRKSTTVLAIALATFCALPLRAQTAPATAPAQAAQHPPTTAPVTLDFPADGVELRTLAEIVSKRLKIPILYDETINAKRVIIRVPKEVPESSLLGILQSALRMKQMALVDAEQPGWKQIIPAQNLAAVAKAAPPPGAPPQAEEGSAVTQVFTLKSADPTRVVEGIRAFLTQPGGNVQPVPGQRVLIVSDYPSVVKRIEQIVTLLDTETTPTEITFIRLHNADAATITPLATQMIANRDTYQFGNPGASGIFLAADERLNQVVVIAPQARSKDVATLIEGLDRSPDLQTHVYRLRAITPERLDRLVKNLLGPAGTKRYQATPDRESQSLVVSASPDILVRIEALLKELDVPAAETQSPIKFYKLKNTKAADVLATIAGLQGEGGLEAFHSETTEEGGATEARPTGMTTEPAAAPGAAPQAAPVPGAPTNPATPATPTTPAPRTPTSPLRTGASMQVPPGGPNNSNTGGIVPSIGGGVTAESRLAQARAEAGETTTGPGAGGTLSVQTKNATVSADPNTNSIIVIAQPVVQQMYDTLIRKLDARRPQVQIECTIVTLDTTDQFTFGVDIAKSGSSDGSKIISFSSFGVATVDPVAGTLTPVAAPGGTFALLSPSIADVVLRALATNSRARLMSAPQLLVNDNGKGTLKSVNQEPFAQILDSSSVQAVTSFGGTAEAGTTIHVEPHISEEDYLQLDYQIELSNFTGAARANLPPPAQTNNVESSVTIPDGYTIVVGGLTVKNLTESLDSLPYIRNIPGLNLLFGTRTKNSHDTTLFVFIKPVILRDDKFEDLKYISQASAKDAGVPASLPQSEPIPLR